MMRKENNVKINLVYNLVYQLLILVIPLITAPYLARVVGVDGIGTYSYTYSIVYYFMLLTQLGVNNYGNRSIAKVRDDKNELSKTFWGIYLFQLLMGLVMIFCYIIYLIFFCKEYKIYATIEILFLISSMVDINWFFFGMEEFKKTITRNTFVKIGSVILIFLIVKDESDLWKYTLIMSGMTCISQFILWSFLINKIKLVKIKCSDIIRHIKPNLILFIPVIAVSLYKMMDKIMLGSLTSVTEVGYYENAEKIVNIPLTFITALGTVMLPRISHIMSKGEVDRINDYISKSIRLVMFMSFAMCCGLIGIGYSFAPLYFGDTFQKTGILIMMLATTLPFLSFANVLRTQYLIPKEMDKVYIRSVSLGALTNLIINFLFIYRFGSIGACIGTIAAEGVVMIYQTMAVKRDLNIKGYFKSIILFFINSIIMLICIYLLNLLKTNGYLKLFFQIFVGSCIYFLLNLKYITSIINIKNILNKIYNKLKNIGSEIGIGNK